MYLPGFVVGVVAFVLVPDVDTGPGVDSGSGSGGLVRGGPGVDTGSDSGGLVRSGPVC